MNLSEKTILFISPYVEHINTSASIRNVMMIKGMEKYSKIGVLTAEVPKDFSSYDETLKLDKEIVTYKYGLGAFTYYYSKKKEPQGKKSNLDIELWIKRLIKLISYPDYYMFWGLNVLLYFRQKKKYDLVISSSDPKSSHLLTTILILLKMVRGYGRYIQIWGDPWYDDITKKRNLFNFIFEKIVLKKADSIYYLSQKTLSGQKKIFPDIAHKMHFISRGYEKTLSKDTSDKKKLKFLYAGDYNSRIRNMMPLINAIEKSEHELFIYGNGHIDLNKEDFQNVKFSERIPFQELNKIINDFDVLVNVSNKFGKQIPGKIIDYIGTEKQILYVLDGDLQEEDVTPKERFIFVRNEETELSKILECFKKYRVNIDEVDTSIFSIENTVKSLLSKNGFGQKQALINHA